MVIHSIGTPGLWAGFLLIVALLLTLDLAVFHRRAHEVRMKEAVLWSVVWIGVALAFNAGVYHWFGRERALEFLTGYLIEKALSVDNIFVFLVLFSHFRVPASFQHRVLFWGILGALVMRAGFIGLGAALVQTFHWVMYVFGAVLVVTGVRMLFQGEDDVHPERSLILRLFRRLVPSVPEYRGTRFLVHEGGRWLATPLLAVLVAVEATDLVFAVDSIPAVFAVTTDPFIVYTSNIFAILGLRALYFVLAGALGRLRFLKVGLSLVLGFVGGKMLLGGVVDVPIGVSLGVIAFLISGAVAASLTWPAAKAEVEG
ncbi:MAG: TerC family protein [Deltaproteobacteria bacterium]|nr:TerC family protein [Deltaproteobacteria bacterium]